MIRQLVVRAYLCHVAVTYLLFLVVKVRTTLYTMKQLSWVVCYIQLMRPSYSGTRSMIRPPRSKRKIKIRTSQLGGNAKVNVRGLQARKSGTVG